MKKINIDQKQVEKYRDHPAYTVGQKTGYNMAVNWLEKHNQKWISVKDRLPEDDVRVLVWVGENSCNFPEIDTDRIHKGRWVRWDEYITHWMPLPHPPKGE